jgi:anti-sigma regulatory factor (Ser/Thr protein kinase)
VTAWPDVSVPCMSLVVAATPEGVGQVRRAVREFAARHGARAEALAAIELAASEAAANAAVHAYDGEHGPVRVDADIEGGELELVVADEGRGFTGAPAPGLGLGLGLVRHGALALEVRDRPLGGVELWARFALAGRRQA